MACLNVSQMDTLFITVQEKKECIYVDGVHHSRYVIHVPLLLQLLPQHYCASLSAYVEYRNRLYRLTALQKCISKEVSIEKEAYSKREQSKVISELGSNPPRFSLRLIQSPTLLPSFVGCPSSHICPSRTSPHFLPSSSSPLSPSPS